MPSIKTERLDLLALDRVQLQAYLNQPAQLEQELNIGVSRDIVTGRVQRAIRMKLNKMESADDSRFAWYTYWLLVVTAEPFGAGLIGFKGFPDENGESEIGYGIDPKYQNRGYTTEAARALTVWAFKEPACLAVVARETMKWNIASQRVLGKLGMTIYQESEDAFCFKITRQTFLSL